VQYTRKKTMPTVTPSHQHNRFRVTIGAAAILLAAGTLAAQSPAARIQAQIDSSALTPIRGSEHALANIASDLGRMPSDNRINGITLRFKRSAAQEAALDALIVAQQNPASPKYHQWLTPDQFAAQFGVAQSDIDKVESWLQQQGFTIDSVNRSHTAIRFSGSVAQVESAFATQMHFYQVNSEKHFAPSSALSIPSAMASVVADIHNLSDFRPRPRHIVPRHAFTSGQTGSAFFAPGDIAVTYDIQPLYSGGVNGAGQTIAIMGQSAVDVTDIEKFQKAAGQSTVKDPNLVLVPGTGTSTTVAGDESESDLDLEWSGGIAPGANIVFVYTGNNPNYGTYDAADFAVDEGIGNIISMSYSTCELDPGLTSSYITSQEAIYKQASAQGQTVLAASGDQGSTACFGDTNLTTAQQEQVAVNYPASSAYITAVGGTEIPAADSSGGTSFSTYWTSNGTNDVTTSAKSYIPEIAWNDDPTTCGTGQNCLSSSGGGTSTHVARPSWQTGVPGITAGSNRLIPDISFYSSPQNPGYLYCTSDTTAWAPSSGPGSPAQANSCDSGFRDSTTGDLTVAGGTSFATPIFAGMVALLNQNGKYVSGSGLLNTTLYQLAANSATYAAAFHDVTKGTNDCLTSTNCSSTTSSSGYSAGPGYDEVTGLGSLDLDVLATKYWPANTGSSAALIGTTTSVTAASSTPTAGSPDVFTVTVFSDSGATVPTGTVTLQIDGGTNCGGLSGAVCNGTTVANQALSATGTVSYTATFSSSGVHSIVAQYSGDATHAASTGVGSVSIAIVSSGKGSISAAAAPATLTVARGGTGTETINITPSGGYTGTVTLNLDFGTTGDNSLANLCAYFSNANNSGLGQVQIAGTAAASGTLTLDTNAADCSSTTGVGGMKPALRPLRTFMTGHIAKNTPPQPGRNPLPPALAFAGLLLVGYFGRHSRRFRNLVAVLAIAAAGMAISACGSSSTSTTVSNPPKGTYTGTITATDSASSTITTTTTFTFVID
jgi:subtilase family serine protease